MPFRDVYLVSEKITPTPSEEISGFEVWLRERFGLPLPRGYREYMGTFGKGLYCDLVCVFTPAKIMTDFKPLGQLWDPDDYFWAAGREVLSEDQAERSIVVGMTIGGDEMVYCPDVREELFVLPHDDDHVYRMPKGLLDPLEWSGVPDDARLEKPRFRYFEPFWDPARGELFTSSRTLDAEALARRLRQRWGYAEVREIRPDDGRLILFAKAVEGRVELITEREGERVSIRFSYDRAHQAEIDEVERMLVAEGM